MISDGQTRKGRLNFYIPHEGVWFSFLVLWKTIGEFFVKDNRNLFTFLKMTSLAANKDYFLNQTLVRLLWTIFSTRTQPWL